MKIEIFDEGKRVINLVFPTAVIFNGLTAKIAAKMIEKTLGGKSEDMDEEIQDLTEIAENLPESHMDSAAVSRMCTEIRHFKRRHPDFVLVEVEDEEGDGIKITL